MLTSETPTCPNRAGIVRAVSGFLAEHGCDIVEHQQFDDPASGRFHLRTRVDAPAGTDAADLSHDFECVAADFATAFAVTDATPPRVLVMVSKLGHCLNDLIFRWRAGSLGAELVAVVANHPDDV